MTGEAGWFSCKGECANTGAECARAGGEFAWDGRDAVGEG